MEKNGTCSSSCVNVLSIAIGMAPIVSKLSPAPMEKYLMAKMAVYVPTELTGMETGVRLMAVLEVKFGMVLPAFVNPALTIMEVCACFASTGKNGTQLKEPVIAQEIMFGMETFVRSKSHALETEFGMTQSSNACALTNNSGMDLAVWFSLSVAVERSGMNQASNATALIALIGMDPPAFSV